MTQAAHLLGVSRQTIYAAVKDGRMRSSGTGWERRIHAEDVFRYALRTGKDIQVVAQRMKARRKELSWSLMYEWALEAAGLAWLSAKANQEHGG